MEALLTSSGKYNRDIAVVGMLGHQEAEKLDTSGILFAAAFNNEMNSISNLSGNCEIGAHGIAHHVGHLINNCGMHGFIVMVNGENVSFNCHTRENGRHFHITRDRQYQHEGLVYVLVHCMRFRAHNLLVPSVQQYVAWDLQETSQ